MYKTHDFFVNILFKCTIHHKYCWLKIVMEASDQVSRVRYNGRHCSTFRDWDSAFVKRPEKIY